MLKRRMDEADSSVQPFENYSKKLQVETKNFCGMYVPELQP
jgi:hypothetical protein